MPRYELGDQFWAIEDMGSTLEITTGKVGERGKMKPRKFVSTIHADKQRALLVTEKLNEGYVEVAAPPPGPDLANPLELAILADPEDDAARAVYADWLAGRGDPRGELALLQIAAAKAPDDRALVKAIDRHFAEWQDELLGPIARYWDDERGAVLGWRAGFIHRLSLDAARIAAAPELILDTVLDHPAGHFLTELEIIADLPELIGEAIEFLALKPLQTLRSLELASVDDLFGLGALAPIAPQLRRLTVRATELRGSAFSHACVASIAGLAWPRLTHFDLRLTRNCDATVRDLAPLFAHAPALTHLRLRLVPNAREACLALAESPIAGQLRVLDLGWAQMQGVAEILATHRARFGSLEELWFTRTAAPPAELAALDAVARRIVNVNIIPALPPREAGDRYDGIRE